MVLATLRKRESVLTNARPMEKRPSSSNVVSAALSPSGSASAPPISVNHAIELQAVQNQSHARV